MYLDRKDAAKFVFQRAIIKAQYGAPLCMHQVLMRICLAPCYGNFKTSIKVSCIVLGHIQITSLDKLYL